MSAVSLIAPSVNSLRLTLSDPPKPADSVSSFAGLLADVLVKLFADSKTDSQIEIDVAAAPNQNANPQHFTITVKAPLVSPTRPDVAAPPPPVICKPATTGSQAPLLTEDG